MKRKLGEENGDDGKERKRQKIDNESETSTTHLLTLDEYIEKELKFDLKNENEHFIKVLKGVIEDYGDSHNDKCQLTVGRNLRSIQGPVNGKDLIRITSTAIVQYNEFDGTATSKLVVDFFGENAEYYIAREGSVGMYVRPVKQLENSDLAELEKSELIEECGVLTEMTANFWVESLKRWSSERKSDSLSDMLPRNLDEYIKQYKSLVGCVTFWWD